MRHRKAKKLRRQNERRSERRAQFRPVIAATALTEEFYLLPPMIRDGLREPYPAPAIHFDQENETAAEIRRELLEMMTSKSVPVGDAIPLSLHQFFTLFMPLMHGVGATNTASPSSELARVSSILRSFFDTHGITFLQELLKGIDEILLTRTAIDRGIWWADVVSEAYARSGNRPSIHIHCEAPCKATVTLDEKQRIAYRCGAPFHRLRWVDWPSKMVRRPEWDRNLPVYVQQHALEMLRERVTIAGPEVEDCMWASLLEPSDLLPGRRSDEFLVEYRFFDHLLGYLPVRRLDDKIVVKTFLFLAMDGTPQHQLLYEKLGLVREDKKATKPDTLNQFLMTDIQDDPVLRRLLAECGCGHLFDIVKPEFRAAAGLGAAREVRRYLKIDPSLAG